MDGRALRRIPYLLAIAPYFHVVDVSRRFDCISLNREQRALRRPTRRRNYRYSVVGAYGVVHYLLVENWIIRPRPDVLQGELVGAISAHRINLIHSLREYIA